MMHDIGYRAKRQASRLIRGRRALVLLYHRIADEASDPFGLCVTPAHFEEHLQAIHRRGTPMALGELVAAVRAGRVPEDAIGLTFDDGYLDNYSTAAPLLRKYGVPATIFFTTGPAGRDREYWWDELERVFLQPGQLPDRLEIEVGGGVRSWELGADRAYTAAQQETYRGWHVNDADAPTGRHRTFREVYRLVQPLRQSERARVMEELLRWGGLGPDQVREERKAMAPDQARDLVRSGLVSAGAHTVNHPDLASQPADAKRFEIAQSKRTLEEWVDREAEGFAYPYGLYDDDTVQAVRESGFRFACAGDHAKVRRGCDLFLLPRVDALPGDGDSLISTLRQHLW
jgi:peptidoglycan/xylan/chitin deacetylase (PgdA/CDA1 family)